MAGAWSDTAWMPAGDRGVRGRGQDADNVQHSRGGLSGPTGQHGNRMVSDAQHVSTERALALPSGGRGSSQDSTTSRFS